MDDEEDVNSNVTMSHFTDADAGDADESSDSEYKLRGSNNDDDSSSTADDGNDEADLDDGDEEIEGELRELELQKNQDVQFLRNKLEEMRVRLDNESSIILGQGTFTEERLKVL